MNEPQILKKGSPETPKNQLKSKKKSIEIPNIPLQHDHKRMSQYPIKNQFVFHNPENTLKK